MSLNQKPSLTPAAKVVFVYPGPPAGLKERAGEFLAGKNFPSSFLMLLDPDYEFTNLYGLRWNARQETAYPSTFLINRNGIVFYREDCQGACGPNQRSGGSGHAAEEKGAMTRAQGVAALLLRAMSSAWPSSIETPAVPVLVELFTSEGCSRCPPADALLSRLDREQPVPGAHIIVLSEHVHYWGRLGLNDRFSSPIFTRRQAKYVRSLDLDGPYTPQVIINGKLQAVGSDPPRSSM